MVKLITRDGPIHFPDPLDKTYNSIFIEGKSFRIIHKLIDVYEEYLKLLNITSI
jgi:hypothetical protein